MDRRHFLGGLTAAGVSAASTLLLGRQEASALEASFGQQPQGTRLRYLTCDRRYVDARPCFSPDGRTVLFMRSPVTNPDLSTFWTIPTASASLHSSRCARPTLFFADSNLQATRPDWSWSRQEYPIAFAGEQDGAWGLYLLDVNGPPRQAVPVPCNLSDRSIALGALSYPSWSADGTAIVATSYNQSQPQHQILLRFDLRQNPATCSGVTHPGEVWPGMSSVSPANADVIAFAAQSPNMEGTYNQNWNQIWIQNGSAPPQQLNGVQGRAPWWSPKGKFIAFESVAPGIPGDSNVPTPVSPRYRIWIQPVAIMPQQVGTAQVLTPPGLDVQHAKWSPDSSQITFAYNIRRTGAQGIALVDVPPAIPQAER
jgi:hypothetical protein